MFIRLICYFTVVLAYRFRCTRPTPRKLNTSTVVWLGLGSAAAWRRSSNEQGELSQWLCHDGSTINIVLELLLLFIIIITEITVQNQTRSSPALPLEMSDVISH